MVPIMSCRRMCCSRNVPTYLVATWYLRLKNTLKLYINLLTSCSNCILQHIESSVINRRQPWCKWAKYNLFSLFSLARSIYTQYIPDRKLALGAADRTLQQPIQPSHRLLSSLLGKRFQL